MDEERFAARLRACRREARLSQQELAERSGLSVRTISNLEQGRTRWPYLDSVYRLADALELRDQARAGFIDAAGRRLDQAPQDPGDDRGRSVPRHLPAPMPVFVGRDAELAALSRLLHQPGGTAVITAIGGTAGVGKTALAVHWAHQVAAEFPDGQLFVNLRGFDPSGSPVTSAQAVRVLLDMLQIPADRMPQTGDGQLGLYRSLLAGKRMLVVLDNARDVAQVRPLLPGSATCRVIVTSRNQLTGLAAIEAARPLTLDVLTGAEARQLLDTRLGGPRLAVDPGATEQIISSCAHLPLALSITAARAAMRPELSLAEIAADLVGQPELDAFSDGDDPATDVRAAFSWSYQQLGPDAARVFRLAGLHPGPSLERHAVAALAGLPVPRAARMLDMLARACMIQPTAHGRYGMHDLLRGYARELAASHDGADQHAALTGLFDYYLRTAAIASQTAFPAERYRRSSTPAPAADGPEFGTEGDALAWLDTERGDLVAVATHAAAHGWPSHAIRLSAVLFRYLETGAQFCEAVTIHGSARTAARQTGDQAAEAAALNSLGVIDLRQGRFQQAAEPFGQALAIYRQTEDAMGEARALSNLGFVDFMQGRRERAVDYQRQALATFQKIGDQAGEARTLATLGFFHLRQGELPQATDHLRQALTLSRQTGDRSCQGRALALLGDIYLRQGHYEQAVTHMSQALASFRETGDRSNESEVLASLGLLDLRQGHVQQATDYLRHALELAEETGDLANQASVRNGLGQLLLTTGRPRDARAQYSAALALAEQAGEKYEQARAHEGLAGAHHAEGAMPLAHQHWRQALTGYAELGTPEADRIRAQLAEVPTSLA